MKRNVNQLVRHFNDGIRDIAPDGYILQGSVVRRHLRRATADGERAYGPYYLWTRKLAGQTVSVALSKEQSELIQAAIRRQRALDRRLAKARTLSEQIIRAITVGVPTRIRRK
jgi:hypothetical protein